MKLHLPKFLLTAVLAVYMTGVSAWAGTWGDNGKDGSKGSVYYVGATETTVDATSGDRAGVTELYLSQAVDGDYATGSKAATIQNLLLKSGDTMTVQNHPWKPDVVNFSLLTINQLTIGGGTGSAAFNVNAGHGVQIDAVSGSFSSLCVAGTLTLGTNALTNIGAVSVASGGTLDLSLVNLSTEGDAVNDVKLVTLMNKTAGAGEVKLKAGTHIQTGGDRTDVNLRANYVVEGDATSSLFLASWAHNNISQWRIWDVSGGGSLQVGENGNGTLYVLAGQQLGIQADGTVKVGSLILGHDSVANNPGSILMTGGELTVQKILGRNPYGSKANEVTITGGTLNVTGTDAVGITGNARLNVSIGGTGEDSVILQTEDNDWVLDGSSTNLGGGSLSIGNVTIDADNTRNITFANAQVSGTIMNNATLTLGENINVISGGSLAIGGTGTTTIAKTITNEGTVTLNGALNIGDLNVSNYEILTLSGKYYATVNSADNTSLSGYTSSDYVIVSGTVVKGETFSYSGSGSSDFNSEYGLLVHVDKDGTRFYVNENIKWGVGGDGYTETVYTDRTATTYVVADGKTLDLNFSGSGGHGWDGKSFELGANSTLTNSGANGNNSWQQIKQISLNGDAFINSDNGKSYGFVASGYGESKLNLNGHTLEKKGAGIFHLLNTTINAGTLKVSEGTLQVGISGRDEDSIGNETNVVMNGGTLKMLNAGNTLTVASISGATGTITGPGELKLVGSTQSTHELGARFDNLGTLTITGNNTYQLTGDNSNIENINLSGGTLQVNGGALTISNSFNHRGGTLQVNGGSVVFDGLWSGNYNNNTVKLLGGKISLNHTNAINNVKNFDVAGNDASTAQVTLAQNVKLQVNGDMWLGNTAQLILEKDAQLIKGDMTIKGTGSQSTITRLTSGNSNTFGYGGSGYNDHEISNAIVDISATTNKEIALKLSGTELSHVGSGTLTVSNTNNSISKLSATGGNVTLSNSMTVESISAAQGKTITVNAGKSINMAGEVRISTTDSEEVATMVAKSDHALLGIQTGSLFSIEDMTLTNASISATNEEVRVNLYNVSGSATLEQGTFVTEATLTAAGEGAKTESGSTSYTYSTDALRGITLNNAVLSGNTDPSANIVLNLGGMGNFAQNATGICDISITLTGFSVNAVDIKGIYFAADSWLGRLLAEQDADAYVKDSNLSVAQVNSQTTGTAGNAGVSVSLVESGDDTVITITGLDMVPEPTTTTLSLLALTALAARRRRR